DQAPAALPVVGAGGKLARAIAPSGGADVRAALQVAGARRARRRAARRDTGEQLRRATDRRQAEPRQRGRIRAADPRPAATLTGHGRKVPRRAPSAGVPGAPTAPPARTRRGDAGQTVISIRLPSGSRT